MARDDRSDRFTATSRRDFLKLVAAGAAVGATGWSEIANAKGAQITFLRESSFVKEFDEFFKTVIIPR